jgi:hypothetical protein
MIKPTPGRIVWFHPSPQANLAQIGSAPLAAIVVGVWSDTCVNLKVFDANGNERTMNSMLLWQGETERPSNNYAEWMPYQLGQAAKTEQVLKEKEG